MSFNKTHLVKSILAALLFLPLLLQSQVDSDKMGAWYMYFFDTKFKDSKMGLQGDIQHRNWNLLGDLEQLLIRSGLTYRPQDANLKLTLGYAHITSGAFGSDNTTTTESRVYQEALYPSKVGNRFFLIHRARYEQRFVEDQNFRTRFRYNLFLNVPINKPTIEEKTYYFALYNEIFINGQKNIGDKRSVERFDRNRFYFALGYAVTSDKRVQLGLMNQTLSNRSKNQLQFSFHHNF